MENNIFEGAKFGDKFIAKNGKIVIYHKLHKYYQGQVHFCFTNKHLLEYNDDGTVRTWSEDYDFSDNDIVSRYQEPIDEDKLDELAKESKHFISMLASDANLIPTFTSYENGYKAGYRKAKEE